MPGNFNYSPSSFAPPPTNRASYIKQGIDGVTDALQKGLDQFKKTKETRKILEGQIKGFLTGAKAEQKAEIEARIATASLPELQGIHQEVATRYDTSRAKIEDELTKAQTANQKLSQRLGMHELKSLPAPERLKQAQMAQHQAELARTQSITRGQNAQANLAEGTHNAKLGQAKAEAGLAKEALRQAKAPKAAAPLAASPEEHEALAQHYATGGNFEAAEFHNARAMSMRKESQAIQERQFENQKTLDKANDQLRLIDDIFEDEGLAKITGIKGDVHKRLEAGDIAGMNPEAARAYSKVQQLRGQVFLQAFETLKGGGQITQVEGEKAENAMARLHTPQSDEDFREALRELRDVVVRARTRLMARMGGGEGSDTPTSVYNPTTGTFD